MYQELGLRKKGGEEAGGYGMTAGMSRQVGGLDAAMESVASNASSGKGAGNAQYI